MTAMDAQSASAAKVLSAPQKALRKLGLERDIDLALHLPLRYEDETRIVRLRDAREGEMVQIEATVTHVEAAYKPRRQLLVTVDDGSDTCLLRFFSAYPSQQKALAVGQRLRIRGELRGGLMGLAMMHPAFRGAGAELPQALTPVYPGTAGLPQPYLRKAVVSALTQADLSETLPPLTGGPDRHKLWSLRAALQFLHHPSPDVSLLTLEDRSHPAWVRLKCEELLAQQLSQLMARRERDHLRAPVIHRQSRGLYPRLLQALPFALTAAQQRVGEEIAANLARSVPMHRLLQG
ncbi:MAG: ATP-dependent DNA helicase RecG, partial [Limnohabitans sp.]